MRIARILGTVTMLGAGVGQLVAVSEGREATMPFHPKRVPYDAYCAAILDSVHYDPAVGEAEANHRKAIA